MSVSWLEAKVRINFWDNFVNDHSSAHLLELNICFSVSWAGMDYPNVLKYWDT